jgi:hypothetical protein
MKKILFTIFLVVSFLSFSQKKVAKKFQTQLNQIEISTLGLDNLVLENATSDFIEIILYAEDYDDQIIKNTTTNNVVSISFEFKGTETREVIFRKFITKRLQRANATIKIPKNKKVTVFGENIDIKTVSLTNYLAIYIDNGIVKLNTIKANTQVKLYSGNVYATIKNTNISVVSTKGKIKIDEKLVIEEYKINDVNFKNTFQVNSIKANVFLTLK